MSSFFRHVFAMAFAAAAVTANAGGPLSVCSNFVPLKYPGAGSVTLRYDLGTLGTYPTTHATRTKAQADLVVNTAIATWTNVSTATVALTKGIDLPVDVTSANFPTYLGSATFADGINPVVYDTDGSITDALLGAGANASVLGFAGSAGYDSPQCYYTEGRAVINGHIEVSDATMTTVLTHELGHFIGLDHTQLDGAQGLLEPNYPLMYPIAYRTAPALHEDDTAAITALYPDTTVNATYGTLTGTFVTAAGTPVRGANLWAQNTTTGKLFSVVSDYLQQGTGYFKLLLTPGTYTLHAEAIDTGFTGGSGVGPFSNDLTDLSFQPPLYSGANGGGSPMAPVTMTGSITIAAGCNATATFRINGTGTVGGNCVTKVNPNVGLSSSVNPSLGGQNVSFTASLSGSAGTPTGTVNFRDGASSISGCSAISVTAGTAACTTAALTAGSHSITAVYSGDGAYNTATSAAVSQNVVGVPGPPVNVSLVAGPGRVTISFQPPANNGGSPITSYTATCTAAGQPGVTASAAASPIVVLGLVAGVSYNCSVSATNASASGEASAAALVTPLPNTDIVPLLLLLLE